jgi:O-antigen ligase
MAVSLYDHVLKRHAWRWKALVSALACILIIISVVHDHPIEWMLIHFTLDPQTGFFRIETWNAALPIIGHSPFTGHGLVELGYSADERMFLRSVDSLWLLEALRYGVPAVILLIMTMFSPLLNKTPAPGARNVQTGLSLAVVTTALIGLTVHFWGATWLFLNLCVGIRASLAEYDARHC